MSGTPFRPFKHASAKTAPAYLQKKKKRMNNAIRKINCRV
jgi:hypothetical protein